MDRRRDEIIERLKAAVQAEPPDTHSVDATPAGVAVKRQGEWLERLRAQILALPSALAPEPEDQAVQELQNRLAQLEHQINGALQPLSSAVRLPAVLLDETLAEAGDTLLDGTAPIISSEAGTAGTGTKALRYDTKPGLQLVGNPGDYTEAGGDLNPTIEPVIVAPDTRHGFRVRLGAVDYGYLAAEYAHLAAKAAGANVTKTGLMLPLDSTGCLRGSAGGLTVELGDGLEIDGDGALAATGGGTATLPASTDYAAGTQNNIEIPISSETTLAQLTAPASGNYLLVGCMEFCLGGAEHAYLYLKSTSLGALTWVRSPGASGQDTLNFPAMLVTLAEDEVVTLSGLGYKDGGGVSPFAIGYNPDAEEPPYGIGPTYLTMIGPLAMAIG
ncbi:MAG: hypothetical protein WC789_09245 [Lentisphaeria bacterium]